MGNAGVIGTTTLRGCCTFVWTQPEGSVRRVVFIRPYHCAACVAALDAEATHQRVTLVGRDPMDRVRRTLAAHRNEWIDRWGRQLLATAEAGFPLDAETARLLPSLLDAVHRTLVAPYGAAENAPPEVRRATVQCGLLTDFISDVALEALPDLGVQEHRQLAEALARAGIEVVLARQHAAARPAPAAAPILHELRTSMTGAQLALDLLRRRGALPESRTARALEESLAKLRATLEQGTLDELLAGGLRPEAIPLPQLVQQAARGARQDARERGVRVVVAALPRTLELRADPRAMGVGVRALLQAAVEASRPGAEVTVTAARARQKARVSLTVDKQRPLPASRLPGLALARRVARLHGGTVHARASARSGCTFTLEVPDLSRDSVTERTP